MGRHAAPAGGTTRVMAEDLAALNDMLARARYPCTPITASKDELGISAASLALFPLDFHMSGILAFLDELEADRTASERRKSVHNKLVVCLYSKENADFPLLQKLYSKERGRPTRAIEDVFLEMAGLVSAAMVRIPPGKRRGVVCGLMHDFGDIVSKLECTICLPANWNPSDPRAPAPSTPVEPGTGPQWIPRRVQRAVNRVAMHIKDPEDILGNQRTRLINALKRACAAVACLANLVRTRLQTGQRSSPKKVPTRAPVKRRHEEANPVPIRPGRRIKL